MSGNPQDEQEGFLERWSRRKTLARQGEVPPEPAADNEAESPEAADPALDTPPLEERVTPGPSGEEAQVPAETDPELPPLESLSEDSDYSVFMGKSVPADLKQEALRKLFHSPKFNVRDGLDDYDLDFTNPEPLGDIVTAEMRYRIERELERLAGLDEDEENAEDAPTVAAAETGEHDEVDNQADPEADDERPEPS